MRLMSMIVNGDRPIAALVDQGSALLILFGDEADAFAERHGRITLIVEKKNGSLRFKDLAGKAPCLILDADAEETLRAATSFHIVRAIGEEAVPVARDVHVRWPITPRASR